MEGYNRWREYPDEITPGSLIRLGHDYVRVVRVVKDPTADGLFIISFQWNDELKLHLSGDIYIDGNRAIETFTKQPS